MKLTLHATYSIQIIQEKFKQHFSHLKIEFYKKPHQDEEGNAKRDQYLHNITLAEITQSEADVHLTIDPAMTTAAFEHYMETEFGLHVQVFRQQRGTWLQTTHSDSLTLAQQNEKGIQADQDIILESPSDLDYQ
jgi:hypothetical protein